MNDPAQYFMHRLHVIALVAMGAVYLLRLIWLHRRFRHVPERQPHTGRSATTPAKGALYSLSLIALPWHLESYRRHPLLYAQFVMLHVGVAATIALSIMLPFAPEWLKIPPFSLAMGLLIIMGLIAAVMRAVRRIVDKPTKAISTLDDYFSITMLIVWLALGLFNIPHSPVSGGGVTSVFFGVTAFLLFYVPFSKISHYLYYPFGRYWLGRVMGKRGVYPMVRVPCPRVSGSRSASRDA